jgi:glycosyltransferase involved in cell wall biosynthesis
MRRWMAENIARFDVALLHDVYSAVSVITARAAARANVPYALQPLGTLSPARERGRPLVKRAFLSFWGKRTVQDASALMYLGDHEARDFLDAGAVRERLVPMPLPLDLPPPIDAPKSERPTVAFVGRLHPIKGIDRLIEATALARRDIPDLTLEIVGPGDHYRKTLEAQARRFGANESVVFHGFLHNADKLQVLRRAHVFALLSRSEGLPMSALEAMACGTPVVLSTGCHLSEVDGNAGLVVENSAEKAADALVKMCSNGELRKRLSAGAAAFAQSYRREKVMPEMISALESMPGIGR